MSLWKYVSMVWKIVLHVLHELRVNYIHRSSKKMLERIELETGFGFMVFKLLPQHLPVNFIMYYFVQLFIIEQSMGTET